MIKTAMLMAAMTALCGFAGTMHPKDKQKTQAIATEDDRPVLMLNCNRYTLSSDFSSNDRYKKWRAVNEKMIEFVGGKILWSLPISGQILFTLSLIHI